MYGKRSCATLTFAPTTVTRRENSSRNRSNAARLSLLVIAMTFGDEVEEIYLDSQNPVWYNGVSPSGNWGIDTHGTSRNCGRQEVSSRFHWDDRLVWLGI